MKVLVIEDAPEIVEAITLVLKIRWHDAEVISTHLGEKGLEMVEKESPDVVILDLGLPDISGFEVLKGIRLFSQVPVIILTVRAEESDIVKGLELGADDYIVKPFRQMELAARLRAVVRRQGNEEAQLYAGPLRLDTVSRELTNGDKKVNLTATEVQILQRLMKNAGNVVPHASLAEAVWGADYPDAVDSLRVHIRRLREKIETDPSNPQLILSRAGVGYLLAKPEQS